MNIKANVKVLNNNTTLKGVADLVFDNEFVVKGVRIIEGEKGLFVSMPSHKVGNEYKQDCFPITAECRDILNKSVLAAFEQKLQEGPKNESQESAEEKQLSAPGKGKSKKQSQDKSEQKSEINEELSENNQGVANDGMSGLGM